VFHSPYGLASIVVNSCLSMAVLSAIMTMTSHETPSVYISRFSFSNWIYPVGLDFTIAFIILRTFSGVKPILCYSDSFRIVGGFLNNCRTGPISTQRTSGLYFNTSTTQGTSAFCLWTSTVLTSWVIKDVSRFYSGFFTLRDGSTFSKALLHIWWIFVQLALHAACLIHLRHLIASLIGFSIEWAEGWSGLRRSRALQSS